MLSNRLSCNIYNLLIASCKIDWQPLTANWAVVDCLSITSPVINVASVMLVLPLSLGAQSHLLLLPSGKPASALPSRVSGSDAGDPAH